VRCENMAGTTSWGLSLLLLLSAIFLPHAGAEDDDSNLHAGSPGHCRGAISAWLQEQEQSVDPETRRSAQHLLRVHEGADVRGEGENDKLRDNRHVHQRPTHLTHLPSHPRRFRSNAAVTSTRRVRKPRHARNQTRGLQSSEAINDGPALCAALAPVSGTQEEWMHALGWAANDANTNPCSGRRWQGCRCRRGRVYSLVLRDETLPAYTLQPAMGNLSGLEGLVLSGTRLSGTIPREL
jgi:hypothetical protein